MKKWLVAAVVIGVFHAPGALGGEREALAELLNRFLAAADQRAMHEQFWAEDLVYTSSSGQRFGKAEILAGFDPPADAANAPAAVRYAAESVQIRLLDGAAVITFRLTADQDGQRIGAYFNTGVFRRQQDGWKAVAWQATRIPGSGAGED
ncbi:MAG: nuclear transport factor 2 family protein [Abyssibacter sp.]|uniref:nuclear transport factor 2 family protein n=1 Tax=Abyssibacter sp. TaxID=2320200 RepID=UPI00321A60D9